MVGAGAAEALKILAQRPAGPVQSHHGVVWREVRLAGEVGWPSALEIDPAQDLRVLRAEGRKEGLEATAELGCNLGWRFGDIAQLTRERLEAACLLAPPTVLVDDGIPEQAIEPRHGALFVANFTGLLESADESLLEDLLGDGAATDAPFEKGEETTVVLDPGRDDSGRGLPRRRRTMIEAAHRGEDTPRGNRNWSDSDPVMSWNPAIRA